MRKRKIIDSMWFISTCVIIIGIGVGWLIGLSVSPVVSTVLTSVTGSIAAIVAALGGLNDRSSELNEIDSQKKTHWRVNPLPLTALVVGITLGSILGLLTRNNHILGSDISAELIKWTKLGVPKEQVVHRLLDTYYPQDPGEGTANTATRNASSPLGSILYAVPAEECIGLLAAVARAKLLEDNQQIVTALISSPHIGLQRLPDIVSDSTVLRQLVEEVLCVTG